MTAVILEESVQPEKYDDKKESGCSDSWKYNSNVLITAVNIHL